MASKRFKEAEYLYIFFICDDLNVISLLRNSWNIKIFFIGETVAFQDEKKFQRYF